MRRVFSTGKFDMIRVSQYLINGLKGGCKGHKYSKNLKKPLSSSTGMTSETLIYHNACTHSIRNRHICMVCGPFHYEIFLSFHMSSICRYSHLRQPVSHIAKHHCHIQNCLSFQTAQCVPVYTTIFDS